MMKKKLSFIFTLLVLSATTKAQVVQTLDGVLREVPFPINLTLAPTIFPTYITGISYDLSALRNLEGLDESEINYLDQLKEDVIVFLASGEKSAILDDVIYNMKINEDSFNELNDEQIVLRIINAI